MGCVPGSISQLPRVCRPLSLLYTCRGCHADLEQSFPACDAKRGPRGGIRNTLQTGLSAVLVAEQTMMEHVWERLKSG